MNGHHFRLQQRLIAKGLLKEEPKVDPPANDYLKIQDLTNKLISINSKANQHWQELHWLIYNTNLLK